VQRPGQHAPRSKGRTLAWPSSHYLPLIGASSPRPSARSSPSRRGCAKREKLVSLFLRRHAESHRQRGREMHYVYNTERPPGKALDESSMSSSEDRNPPMPSRFLFLPMTRSATNRAPSYATATKRPVMSGYAEPRQLKQQRHCGVPRCRLPQTRPSIATAMDQEPRWCTAAEKLPRRYRSQQTWP